MIICSECGKEIPKDVDSCVNCGNAVTWQDNNHQFNIIVSAIEQKDDITITPGLTKTLKWFALANAAVILSITITTGGAGVALVPLLLILGATFPFGALLLSKWLAKKAHNIKIIDSNSTDSAEMQLYNIVDVLRKRAGISEMPEVGVYKSKEMNAFATGPRRNNALIAFTNTLLRNMELDEITAVAAHEIAHIANGDMITLSIVQAVVNALVLLISIPLSMLKFIALISDDVDWFVYAIVALVKFLIVSILLFLGNLVVKAFSRRREFEADRLAAQLVNPTSMIKALEHLGGEVAHISYDKSVESYSTLKISSPLSTLGDLFSTHPSIERRVVSLQSMQDEVLPKT